MTELSFKTRAEMLQEKMDKPTSVRILLDKKDYTALKKVAFLKDTTVPEIVRVVMRDFVARLNEEDLKID